MPISIILQISVVVDQRNLLPEIEGNHRIGIRSADVLRQQLTIAKNGMIKPPTVNQIPIPESELLDDDIGKTPHQRRIVSVSTVNRDSVLALHIVHPSVHARRGTIHTIVGFRHTVLQLGRSLRGNVGNQTDACVLARHGQRMERIFASLRRRWGRRQRKDLVQHRVPRQIPLPISTTCDAYDQPTDVADRLNLRNQIIDVIMEIVVVVARRLIVVPTVNDMVASAWDTQPDTEST